MNTNRLAIATLAAVGIIATGAFVFAQQSGPGWNRGGWGPGMMQGWGSGRGSGWGPGMMREGWGGSMMGWGCPMMGYSGEGRAEAYVDGRLAFLKTELAITDAQAAPWDNYTRAIKQNFASMQGVWAVMLDRFEAASPVERLDVHISAMESRLGALKQVKPALGQLYGVLGPQQKEKADTLLTEVGCMM